VEHTPARWLSWDPAPDDHFTGRAWFGPLSQGEDRPLNALGVLFEPSARTDWHTHPEGQVLYVVAGAGRVQTADGETVEVGPGDVVHAPPGEEHWHGASPGSFMMHLSLTTGGATEWLDRPVTDVEYERRHY
jgi:quercetin dioxygenase-like cupin family protein